MEIIVWYVIGLFVGIIGGRYLFKEKPVGFLRIDRSDPDGLLLFLELKQNMKDISRKKAVTFLVKHEDFIPHD